MNVLISPHQERARPSAPFQAICRSAEREMLSGKITTLDNMLRGEGAPGGLRTLPTQTVTS